MRFNSAAISLLASASAFAFTSAAYAQAGGAQPPAIDQPTAAAQPPGSDTASPAAAPQPTAPAAPAAAVSEVVVTGSRVLRNGDASPTPLTTVDTQTLLSAAPAGTIADALNELPVFSGSRSTISNPGASASGLQGGNGAADVLNLRNLGAYRTLVLYDGHRIPPTLFNSTVDVDLIPQELISRVDVVTGGVSAVYGSDAVSGVVNFVANRHFEGVEGHTEYGISQRGDDATRNVAFAVGSDVLDGRGHVEASYQFRDSDGIPDNVRSWNNLAAVEGAGTAANPYHLVTNTHLSAFTFGGLINTGALAGQNFAANGVLSPFQAGAATGSSCCQIGGSGAYQNGSMVTGLTSNQLFGRFDYDVTGNIHAFLVVAANLKNNSSYNGYNQLTSETLSSTNAFLPAAYQAVLAAAGQTSFTLSDLLKEAARTKNDVDTDQYYLNAGLEGKLGDYHWDLTYT
ncbi:MAG: TonB-dependent receptor plug domain-containing protein, partial [Caulobacteraceae bacterium]